jgi:hypothetical protein
MMGRMNKYLMLFLLITGGFLAVVLAIALVVFLLKLFAGVVSAIPGSDFVYRLIVTLVPYTIYAVVYYFLFRHNQRIAGRHWGRPAARILMFAGMGICVFTAILALMVLFGSKHPWAFFFDNHSYLALSAQILILFFTTMFMALSGAEK